MLILGVVRLFQPVHGYDVRRELLSWHADEWANVAPVFQDLLRRHWWEFRPPIDPFVPAFTFLPALPREEGVAALRHRAQVLRLYCDGVQVRMRNDLDWEHAPHVAELFRLNVAQAQVQADWCDAVAARLEAGELQAADDPVPSSPAPPPAPPPAPSPVGDPVPDGRTGPADRDTSRNIQA
ncbi:MAG: hypothetical protein AUI14_25850 [Actinobacteria bacterium 13_2_20CM_2_71_6]|nr:MAG: hypothetical protein AUI14_25850 [Actinobacteria bacterium 13_2_20CM_2_71_6]